MGKSPGKWIKTLLFRKKTSGSSVVKGRETLKAKNGKDVWVTGKEPNTEVATNHPLTSAPVTANANRNAEISESEKGLTSNASSGGPALPGSNDAGSQLIVESESSDALENVQREQAAIQAQAAFRGYLARRAFRTLKGIVRLQALVRGHLVRRQAVATLRCLRAIVKLQAVVRAQKVRHSDIGTKIQKKFPQGKIKDARGLDVSMSLLSEKPFANAYVRKLLSTSTTGMPLTIQYSKEDPNSAWKWLERWTFIFFLKPLAQGKRVSANSKGMVKPGSSHTVETEIGRSKYSTLKSSAVDSGSAHLSSEFEKPKRNIRKIASHPVDTVQEHPQSELEKVKRNLRKVSNSGTDVSDRLEAEADKPKRSLKKGSVSSSEVADHQQEAESEKPKRGIKKGSASASEVADQQVEAESEKPKRSLKKGLVSSSEAADQQNVNSVEKKKKDLVSTPTDNIDVETSLKPVATDARADTLNDDCPPVELHPPETNGKEVNNISAPNGELNSKEDQVSNENQRSKRRASLSAKADYSENGLQNTSTLPSYMAATESAKAKLRLQGSPRFSHDGSEKNGITRRHSLPSATGGKVSSPSVRGQKPVQVSGKVGAKTDKSLLSSRDGNEKVIQTEWRR